MTPIDFTNNQSTKHRVILSLLRIKDQNTHQRLHLKRCYLHYYYTIWGKKLIITENWWTEASIY